MSRKSGQAAKSVPASCTLYKKLLNLINTNIEKENQYAHALYHSGACWNLGLLMISQKSLDTGLRRNEGE